MKPRIPHGARSTRVLTQALVSNFARVCTNTCRTVIALRLYLVSSAPSHTGNETRVQTSSNQVVMKNQMALLCAYQPTSRFSTVFTSSMWVEDGRVGRVPAVSGHDVEGHVGDTHEIAK